MIYLSLFIISFLAATILPFSSELTLAGLVAISNYDNLLLLIVASLGNVLGSDEASKAPLNPPENKLIW